MVCDVNILTVQYNSKAMIHNCGLVKNKNETLIKNVNMSRWDWVGGAKGPWVR